MTREQPEYLAKLPKDRHGLWLMAFVALVLLFTMYGAWKLYIGTVQGWENRFNRPTARPEASQYTEMAAANEPQILPAPQPLIIDKCIDGTAFVKLADGGWTNIPGIQCSGTKLR